MCGNVLVYWFLYMCSRPGMANIFAAWCQIYIRS